MTLMLEDKKAIVAGLKDQATQALSVVTADYRGLTVTQMTELRNKARESGVHLQVVRNTLAKRALSETEFSCLDEVFKGPVLLAFSIEDPGSAARVIRDFCKQNEQLKVTALSIGGQLLGASELKTLASLPTRDQALGMLAGVMQAPITKSVQTMAATYTKFVRTVQAVADKREAA